MAKRKVKINRKSNKQTPKQAKQEERSTILRDILRGGGHALGSFFGPAGGSFGHEIGSSLSRWLGAGDYQVSSNNLTKMAPEVLPMHTNKQELRLAHREYLGDLMSSATVGGFSATNYNINPGLASTFPWLSTVAQQFQEYEFHGLIFEIVSASGDTSVSATTSIGTFMAATNYRSPNVGFLDKISMLQTYFANECKISHSLAHPIECDPRENAMKIQYVRGGPVPAGEDVKSYDLGLTTIASNGVQTASAVIGSVWVTYDVTLRKAIDTASKGLYTSYAHYTGHPINLSSPYVSNVKNYDSMNLTVTSGTVNFPPGCLGNYMLITTFTANIGAAYTGFTNPSNVNITPQPALSNYAGSIISTQFTTGGNNPVLILTFSVTDPTKAAAINITGPSVSVSTSLVDLFVIQLNGTAVGGSTL